MAAMAGLRKKHPFPEHGWRRRTPGLIESYQRPSPMFVSQVTPMKTAARRRSCSKVEGEGFWSSRSREGNGLNAPQPAGKGEAHEPEQHHRPSGGLGYRSTIRNERDCQ